jgi:hypothetical protein
MYGRSAAAPHVRTTKTIRFCRLSRVSKFSANSLD